ncbi:MAG TPA: PfkB family carbohydrate kinase, partial [Eudoraea sp.]|nr:PfkB family carbohydrate kinase [Eudoraea sp.]
LWNFAPAQDFDLKYLKKSDILVVNESEAGFLTNMEVGDQQSAEKAIQKLLKRGPALIILTLGADGVLCASKGKIKHLSAFKVHAEDTTAAGDVFCGTFSVAHVEGNTLTNSIRFASAAAALCVTKIGAQPSIPHRLEIDAFLAGQ